MGALTGWYCCHLYVFVIGQNVLTCLVEGRGLNVSNDDSSTALLREEFGRRPSNAL
jgi:hypothetical protein